LILEVGYENKREKKKLEEAEVDVKTILRQILRKRAEGGVDWIDLAQDRDKCWTLANTVTSY
jgi:hypothetical protein